jgi:hypothetical protein
MFVSQGERREILNNKKKLYEKGEKETYNKAWMFQQDKIKRCIS